MRSGARPTRIIIHGVMILLVLLWLLPLWTSLLVGLKSTQDYLHQTFWQLPSDLSFFSNAVSAWSQARMGTNFFNSLLYGIIGAAGAIILASLASYSLVRFRPRFGFLLFLIIWSGTIFPYQMYLIPLFRMYLTLGLYDTRLGLMLFYIAIAIPFSTFVLRGYFSTIPTEISEAAGLDGCSNLGILFRFILPLSKSSIAVLVLFIFIWIWNDLIFGLVLSKSPDARTVMAALSQLVGAYTGGTNYPVLMAGTIIVSLPVVVLYLFLKKEFIRGLVLTTAGE